MNSEVACKTKPQPVILVSRFVQVSTRAWRSLPRRACRCRPCDLASTCPSRCSTRTTRRRAARRARPPPTTFPPTSATCWPSRASATSTASAPRPGTPCSICTTRRTSSWWRRAATARAGKRWRTTDATRTTRNMIGRCGGSERSYWSTTRASFRSGLGIPILREAVISAKNHERQRRKRQSVTAKREKSQTP